MARPTTYGDSQYEQDASAGAATLDRIAGLVRADRDFDFRNKVHADQLAREDRSFEMQKNRDARADTYAERANSREERMANSASLEDKLKQLQIQKEEQYNKNALDTTDWAIKQSADANAELHKIDPREPDALQKFYDVQDKYPAAAHPKFGDPRFIKQSERAFELIKFSTEARQRAEDARAKAMLTTPAEQELATHREIRSLQQRDQQLARDIGSIEKQSPAWLNTTGLHTDGQFRFANEDTREGKGGTAPFKPSEADVAKYRTYKAAVAERERIASQLEKHNANLESGFKDSPAAPAVAAHPMEGQIVKQKSTGKMGRIVNGQFVAE